VLADLLSRTLDCWHGDPSLAPVASPLSSASASATLSTMVGIELGAGLGLPSLVAARRGVQMCATDGDDAVLELLRSNAERNARECAKLKGAASTGAVQVSKFEWIVDGDDDDDGAATTAAVRGIGLPAGRSAADLILAADCVYGNDAAVWQSLIDTLSTLCGPDTLVLLANVERHRSFRDFVAMLVAAGFTAHRVQQTLLHADFQADTAVYALRRQQSAGGSSRRGGTSKKRKRASAPAEADSATTPAGDDAAAVTASSASSLVEGDACTASASDHNMSAKTLKNKKKAEKRKAAKLAAKAAKQ
jgi:hypothetical protein